MSRSAAFLGAALLLAGPVCARDRQLKAPKLDPVIAGQAAPSAAPPGQAARQVTLEIPDGCGSEIRGKCPGAFTDVGTLRACLDAPENDISSDCVNAINAQLAGASGPGAASPAAAKKPATRRKPLTLAGARAKALAGCAGDAKQFCSDVGPARAEVLACLKAYSDQVSGSCADALGALAALEDGR